VSIHGHRVSDRTLRDQAGDGSVIVTRLVGPDIPVATAATGEASDQFTANLADVEGAWWFELQVATDIEITMLVTGFDKAQYTALSALVSGLDSETDYFYRWRAAGPNGYTAWSNVITATTTAGAVAFLHDTFTGGPESLGVHLEDNGGTWTDGGGSDTTTVENGSVGLIVDSAERFSLFISDRVAPTRDYTMRVVAKRTAPDDETNWSVEGVVAMRYGPGVGDWLLLSINMSEAMGQQARIVLKTASAVVLTSDDVPFVDDDSHEFSVVLNGDSCSLLMDGSSLRAGVDLTDYGMTGLQTYLIWSGHAPSAAVGVPCLAWDEIECSQ
jgi:hypothetical protein